MTFTIGWRHVDYHKKKVVLSLACEEYVLDSESGRVGDAFDLDLEGHPIRD